MSRAALWVFGRDQKKFRQRGLLEQGRIQQVLSETALSRKASRKKHTVEFEIIT